MRTGKFIRGLIDDLMGLFFPRICYACGEVLYGHEEVICNLCIYQIPRTNYHRSADNPVSRLFWGRVNVDGATSFFSFSKGSRFQGLIHQLKYKGKTEIGYVLGRLFGIDLKESPVFSLVDVVIPVPLHPDKQKKRGFNQCWYIADGIAFSLQVPVDCKSLYRGVNNETQTRKSRFERWKNVRDIFGLRDNHNLDNKHILLIDDVITTGATLESCAETLLKAKNVRVSIATLAAA
ncbi:MAG: ComF family protein [Bacteroidia bacterium]|nr:ComF family protein [Bacteroidia bacterium]